MTKIGIVSASQTAPSIANARKDDRPLEVSASEPLLNVRAQGLKDLAFTRWSVGPVSAPLLTVHEGGSLAGKELASTSSIWRSASLTAGDKATLSGIRANLRSHS
jgi:hypothetical protein